MIDTMIVWLIRKKLKLKKKQQFYFKNQANKTDRYRFINNKLMKDIYMNDNVYSVMSQINLNFFLGEDIEKLIIRC